MTFGGAREAGLTERETRAREVKSLLKHLELRLISTYTLHNTKLYTISEASGPSGDLNAPNEGVNCTSSVSSEDEENEVREEVEEEVRKDGMRPRFAFGVFMVGVDLDEPSGFTLPSIHRTLSEEAARLVPTSRSWPAGGCFWCVSSAPQSVTATPKSRKVVGKRGAIEG